MSLFTASRTIKTLLLLVSSCWLFSSSAMAQTWEADQGDILVIEAPLPAGVSDIQVRAMEKNWPPRRTDHGLVTWIGVDMATSPGEHALLIGGRSDGGEVWQRQDTILVHEVAFPKSYIDVEKKMAEFDAETLARIRAEAGRLRAAYAERIEATPDIAFSQQPAEGVLSSPFGARRIVNGEPRSPHSGIDIAAAEGVPIVAPLAGRVLVAESMYLNGNAVAIGHGNGLVSVYTHMQSLEVEQGQWLDTGERIGAIGMSGRSTGPHLHWGVRFNNARIDPRNLLPADSPLLQSNKDEQ
ncbi:MAG: M23 family metallopeptidase [Mariprofundaceae bacterium]